MPRYRGTPEGAVLKAVLDFCAAKRILTFRMNTGAMKSEYNGKTRFMRFGTPGMADILAFPVWHDCGKARMGSVLWIEVKTATGKQSEAQKAFQRTVEAEGHKYIIARSIDDLADVVNAKS